MRGKYSGHVNTYSGETPKVFTFTPESAFTLRQNMQAK